MRRKKPYIWLWSQSSAFKGDIILASNPDGRGNENYSGVPSGPGSVVKEQCLSETEHYRDTREASGKPAAQGIKASGVQGLLRIPSLLGFFLRLSLMQEIRTLHLRVSPVACLSCLTPFSPNAEGSHVWHHLSHSHSHSSYLMVPIHTSLVLPYTSFLLYWLNWSLDKCVEYIHSSE